MPEQLTDVLRFFKALAHQSRLRMLGLIAEREYSVRDLAASLELKEPTVSHHLAKLADIGLLRRRDEGTTHYYALDAEALERFNQRMFSPETINRLALEDIEDVSPERIDPPGLGPLSAYDRNVLDAYFEGNRLNEIPASRKKREVILRWLAAHFQPGRRYSHRDLNAALKRHHPDSATLRRELIAGGLMQRDAEAYWRGGA